MERAPVLQLEECVRNLQHQYMWVIVLMADQDALACPPHSMLLVVLLQPIESRKNRGIFFWLVLFRAKCVITEGEEANGFGLI